MSVTRTAHLPDGHPEKHIVEDEAKARRYKEEQKRATFGLVADVRTDVDEKTKQQHQVILDWILK
jgi:hypothetical protein